MRLPLLLCILAALNGCGGSLPPVIEALPAFELVNQDGSVFDRNSLKGKLWVVAFFFTRCPSICPPMIERMESIAKRWPNPFGPHLLSISIDPKWDTPERLNTWAKEKDLPLERWTLATGEEKSIRDLCEGTFRLAMGRGMDEGGDILHSPRFVLVDWDGNIRGMFDGLDDAGHEALDEALRSLISHSQHFPEWKASRLPSHG